MTLCKFYLQGNCKFGDNCRFEHRPPKPHESEYNEWRRNHPESYTGQGNAMSAGGNPDDSHATRKGWSQQIIFDNLKIEHPSWPFTSFGAPYFRSLISADLSFEEYHLAALEANRNGTFPQWQQEMNQRLADVENQEENVLRNIQEAWMYNANEPYYPTGRLGSQPAQSGFLAGGSSNTQSSFLNTPQSTFGSTSSFLKPATSFGSSPFGAMPASAFSLGSRDPNASNQSAFGATPSTSTSTSAFGQARSTGFGATSTTPSAFGSTGLGGTTPAFGAASNPTNAQHTFGQPSTLGAGGLPPAPGSGFGAKPTFGQTSTLGALGSSTSTFGQTSTPTFGQASAFSSPFAGGLGKALGGTTSTGTFGSKSTFGTFGQAANQPSAFAQAAGTGQQNAFLQAAGQGQQNAFTQSANQFSAPAANSSTPATDAFGAESTRPVRFTVLNEMDDDMTDAISPGVATDATQSPTTVSQEGANQPQAPTSVSAPASQPAAQTTDLSNAFGGLTASSQPQSQAQPSSTAPLTQTPPILKPSSSTTTTTTPAKNAAYKKPIIDEMAAWRAGEFTIGQIPETEPPLEVR